MAGVFGIDTSKAGTPRIDTAWLLKGQDLAECPLCFLVLEQPTTGCPEGHACCKSCYIKWLLKKKECPNCSHATDESKYLPSPLQRCRPLEGLIGQLPLRCKHGADDPSAKRAKLGPAASSADDPREDLGRRGLSTEGGGGEQTDGGLEGKCEWRGMACEFPEHLLKSCGNEPVQCPNAVAGCNESVMRKDAPRHASETCAYRETTCKHCRKPFAARALPTHAESCPEAKVECPNWTVGCKESVLRKDAARHASDTCTFRLINCVFCPFKFVAREMPNHRGCCSAAQIECPNAGCGVVVARRSMEDHRGVCGRERMTRAEVETHVQASAAQHLQVVLNTCTTWGAKVAEQGTQISDQITVIAGLGEKVAAQGATMAQLGTTISEQATVMQEQNTAVTALQLEGAALGRTIVNQVNVIAGLGAKVAEQGATIGEQGRTISFQSVSTQQQTAAVTALQLEGARQGRTIAQQGSALKELQDNVIPWLGSKVAEQGATIAQQETTISGQAVALKEQNTAVAVLQLEGAEQGRRIVNQDKVIAGLGSKVAKQGATIGEQGKTITALQLEGATQGRTIVDQGSALKELKDAGLEAKVAEQNVTIAAQGEALKELHVVVARLARTSDGGACKTGELEAKVGEQSVEIAEQGRTIAEQEAALTEQIIVVAGMQRRAAAVSHEFTWTTKGVQKDTWSEEYTFADGVRGYCFDMHGMHYMGFQLMSPGPKMPFPVCGMHYECWILDKRDKLLRMVSLPEMGDFEKNPVQTAKKDNAMGISFEFTEEDSKEALRKDGSIKLRMVVHLYVPVKTF
ncbi:hypothetical protein T484DRAFT_1799676 [Baffinella frigidus]|nr:hypothetical protein T484DRAFT_1799676 [Cryptophyta sp. CCMP2293]